MDNRPDLVRHLRQSRRESSDIELIAASYEEKGEEAIAESSAIVQTEAVARALTIN
ncbi:MAG TPA: hypothetical protein VM282_27830 [Acidimicrobiales bacterium]|nr:hypothetical protein [Acidimicrobiales bacterium]